MSYVQQIATQLRGVYFGGNWTSVNVKDILEDVTWQQAITQIQSCNSIATLVNHMTYYVSGVAKVLHGKPLSIKDKFSFEHPPINSSKDWEQFLQATWIEAENFAIAIEQFQDESLHNDFTDSQYGNYYRNLHGIIEHLHYHLGQIVIIKKIIKDSQEA